jgi:ATP/ADP translocase
MLTSRNLLRALNVRKDEWWLVRKLFLLQFFQGAGITFFFTSSFARFLEHFDISQWATVFILTSFLLWAAGFIYSKLEHHLPLNRLCVIVTSFLAGSMVLFRIGEEFVKADWVYFLMLAWFNVLYLLNNLMFWGIAAQLYDVRQSKRLFAVISAGDIPAKFIGYSVALVIVSYIGTANLLLVGLLFILFSFPYLKKILQSEKKGKIHHYEPERHVSGFKSILKNFTVNTLVRRVALLSLIVSACIILINYGFYSEVKEQNKDDVALARFIAFFLAIARLIAILIKILFTSRLLYWLGNRIALMITPVLLIVLMVSLELTGAISNDTKNILYIFGLSAILADVLNSAINSPVILTMMQPLSTPERLRAHNIVKGIMDPFAYFFSGIFLLVFIKLKLYNLHVLTYVLMGLAAAWIVGIFRVHKEYLSTLIKTISSRFFTQDEFDMLDTSTQEMIEKKIKDGSELEVMYILKMLSTRRTEESKKLIILALSHPSERVVYETLRLIADLHIKDAEQKLLTLVETHPVDKIRNEALKTFGNIAFKDDVIAPLMNSNEKIVRQSAAISILNHSSTEKYRNQAGKMIKDLLTSNKPDEKREATAMLCETSHGDFDHDLIELLNDRDIGLVHTAIRAMGHHPSNLCLEHLIRQTDIHEKPAIEALVVAGEKALPFIKKKITDASCTSKLKEKLINVIGRIGGKEGNDLLLQLLQLELALQSLIIKILHRYHFKAAKQNQPIIDSLIRDYLVYAAAILHMQKKMADHKLQYQVLSGSLQLELNGIRETLLYLFSFIYDREKIGKIKVAIELSKKETNANAIELVDMTVKKEFANPFNAAFEHGDLEYRCDLLKSIFPKDLYPAIDVIIEEVLTDKRLFYNNWTKACSLYTTKKIGPLIEQGLIKKYLISEDMLLKETALFAAGKP